jgi:hypothetical protein
LDRRLAGPQSHYGRGGEEKNSQTLLGLEYPIIHPIAHQEFKIKLFIITLHRECRP